MTSSIISTSAKFRKENPKTYAVLLAAVKEAIDWINANQDTAGKVFIRITNSKLDPALINSIHRGPETQYEITPDNTFAYAEFLHRTGALKNKAICSPFFLYQAPEGAARCAFCSAIAP